MHKMLSRSFARTAFIAGITAGMACTISAPASAEVDFKGKQIVMIIGNAAGGGTDAVGRLVGEYLTRYLPGKPTLIVRNMPGAGGITALNFFATQVKNDGTYLTTGASTQTDPVHWRAKASKYDPRDFRMIGGIVRGSTVLMLNKKAVERLTDKSKPLVVVGAIDGTRSGIIMSMWGGKYLGWNIKWVTGYGGTSELILALQRGEIDLTSTANSFLIREMLQKGSHVALAQSGTLVDGKLIARAAPTTAPHPPDQIRPHLKSELEQQAFGYWEGINATDKWLALPKGTPDDVVKAYETAFLKAVKDPTFIQRGKASISEDISALNAADQDKLVRQLAATTDEALTFIENVKKEQGLRSHAKKKVAIRTVSTKIDAVENKSRVLVFKAAGKTDKVELSGGATEIKIAGTKASRRDLKAGMACDISYGASGSMAKAVTCK